MGRGVRGGGQNGALSHGAPGRWPHASGPSPAHAGFTLVELIVVMVVIGILAAIVAVFICNPIEGYLAVSRRAELADAANTALLRIAREVRAALPNSVRVSQSGGVYYLEYLPLADAGRFRAAPRGDGGGDILDFTSGSDASFDVLGPTVSVAAGQYLVIYNLGVDSGTDAYQGGNRRTIVSNGSVSNLLFTATGTRLPLEPPDSRFHVATGPVTYVCDPVAHTLRRYSGYAIQAVQPSNSGAPPLSTASSHLLAQHVSACRFAYDPGASHRLGQLTLTLSLSQEGGTVNLYREVVVNNDA